MDNSRDKDLLMLYERFNTKRLSRNERQRAFLKFQRVQAQLKDRGLTKLRYALIKASRVGNSDDVDKIEQQIKEYARLTGRRTP